MKTLVVTGLFLIFGLHSYAVNNTDSIPASDDARELAATDSIMLNYFKEQGFEIDPCAYLPLYREAYSWIGVPYRYGGKTKTGIDCSSLVKGIYNGGYNWELNGSSRTLFDQCTPIESQKDLVEGDLLFFKINKPHISHVAVYLGDGYFVHASVKRGVMINRLSEKYYKNYFFKGGRLKHPGPQM